MKPILLFVFLLFFLFKCKNEIEQPYILFILADDLDYGELGSYGHQLIETPNLAYPDIVDKIERFMNEALQMPQNPKFNLPFDNNLP